MLDANAWNMQIPESEDEDSREALHTDRFLKIEDARFRTYKLRKLVIANLRQMTKLPFWVG